MSSFAIQDFDFSAFLNLPNQADAIMDFASQPDTHGESALGSTFASHDALPPPMDQAVGPDNALAGGVAMKQVFSSGDTTSTLIQKPHLVDEAMTGEATAYSDPSDKMEWQQPPQTHHHAQMSHGNKSNVEPLSTEQHVSMSMPPLLASTPSSQQISDGALSYSARIAAHHSQLLHSVLPTASGSLSNVAGRASHDLNAKFGVPGQTSLGVSISSSAVSLSQSAQRALTSTGTPVTLQERRRNARRAQHARAKAAATRIPHSTSVPDARHHATGHVSVSGINTSGRNVKRVMNTSTGRIYSPQSTENIQSFEAYAAQQEFESLTQERQAPLVSSNGSAASVYQADNQAAQLSPVSRQAYSSSGFDLLGALARVVLRPNPRISLGPVDLSCSFTVCDARHPEQPIIYCSDTFCMLTGYTRNEILGRNCRFLQSPDGKVQRGSERFHTDNAAVAHMKQHSNTMQECQASLINYRRNGSPFINLVTIVPIGWADSTEPVYLVGFQVDLVEQPSAILERSQDGSYVVNYNAGGAAGISLAAPPGEHLVPGIARDLDQEAAAREVSIGKEFSKIMAGGKEESGQWARIVLQHSHDLIHVLSLKGTFLHVSPSVERLLGFKPEELIGKSISDFCHPSDVVPVFRELKDSTSNASINAAAKRSFRADGVANRATKGGVGQGGPEVNLLMRMRHKTQGHVWIESKGKLHLEQGKGRKVVISSGRRRAVYNLSWEPVKKTLASVGDITGFEKPHFWAKVSNDGLVLSATDGVSTVVEGLERSTLFGRHLTEMVNTEAMPALLEALRGLSISTVTHQMWNAMEEPVWVSSTLFPSAVMPGAHIIPTVFVHVTLARLEGSESSVLNPNILIARPSSEENPDKAPSEPVESGAVPGSSVFGELSTQRSTSHIFELHSLKHVNRRLREAVRTAQRRVDATLGVQGPLPMSSSKRVSSVAAPPAPLREDFVNALNERNQRRLAPPSRHDSMFSSAATRGNSSAGLSSSGAEVTSGNGGSASDSTAPTTAISSGNNSDEGPESDAGKNRKTQMV